MRHAPLSYLALGAALIAGAGVMGARSAAAQTVIEVTISDHRFAPDEIHVPAGQSVVLHIVNKDPLAEEFDSPSLKVEKVIAGGRDGNVRLRPLDKGQYPFTGEYHADTAKGAVIAE